MYVVNLLIDGEVISVNHSHHTMAKTLKLAFHLVDGICRAECAIRRAGNVVALLETDSNGELREVEIWTTGMITPLNPRGKMFQK